MDDWAIIDLYFARDEKAIEETDKKYRKLCLSVANNILLNGEDSEECLNDTYLCVWNKIPPTRPKNLMAFICQIIRFLSMKRLEHNSALKRSRDMTVSYSELENILPDDRISPDIEYEDIGSLISDFLRHEKEASRNVFIRKYYYFDTISDIAEKYSFSESKVKNMLFRSRIRLRETLKKGGVEV